MKVISVDTKPIDSPAVLLLHHEHYICKNQRPQWNTHYAFRQWRTGQIFARCHVKPAFNKYPCGCNKWRMRSSKHCVPSVVCMQAFIHQGLEFIAHIEEVIFGPVFFVGNLSAPVRFIRRTNPTAADITDNPHTHTTRYRPSQLGWNCPDWFNILCGRRYRGTCHQILNSKIRSIQKSTSLNGAALI